MWSRRSLHAARCSRGQRGSLVWQSLPLSEHLYQSNLFQYIFRIVPHTLSPRDWWSRQSPRQTDESKPEEHICLFHLINRWSENETEMKEYICSYQLYNLCMGLARDTFVLFEHQSFQKCTSDGHSMWSPSTQREAVTHNKAGLLSVHERQCIWKPGGEPVKT